MEISPLGTNIISNEILSISLFNVRGMHATSEQVEVEEQLGCVFPSIVWVLGIQFRSSGPQT